MSVVVVLGCVVVGNGVGTVVVDACHQVVHDGEGDDRGRDDEQVPPSGSTTAAFHVAWSVMARAKPHSALGLSVIRPRFCQARTATMTAIVVHGRCPKGVIRLRSIRLLRTA